MKRIIFLLLSFMVFLSGCVYDPLETDLYTQNIYPNQDSTYQIGDIGNEYSTGYFDSVNSSNGYFNDLNSVIRNVMRRKSVMFLPNNITGYTNTLTGSAYSYIGNWYGITFTGATDSSSNGYVGGIFNYFQMVDSEALGFVTLYQVGNSADMREDWIGFFADTTTYPTGTSNHFGFRFVSTGDGVNCDLYATNGNGATNTQTLLVSSIPAWQTYYLMALYKTNGDIDFYYAVSASTISWSSATTQSTNIPASVFLYYGYWLKNTEAVDKRASFYPARFFISSDVDN